VDGAGRSAARAADLVEEQAPQLAEAFETAVFAPRESGRPALDVANESRRWESLWAALRRLWLAVRLHV
jgi:hypothetical protein